MNTSLVSFTRSALYAVSLIVIASFATACNNVSMGEAMTYRTTAHNRGLAEFSQQNYGEAAGAFRNAIRQDPRDYKSRFYLGACYEQMRQYHQAIEAYKSSLDSQELTLTGREDEAQRLQTMEALASCVARVEIRDAETDLLEQQARRTQRSRDYYLLAKVYRFRGDPDSALDWYNRAALKDPNDFALIKEYGLYLESLGQQRRAESTLRRAYAMRPYDQEVNMALRRMGIIPGPAIKDESKLVRPTIPKGPIPEVDLSNLVPGGAGSAPAQEPAPALVPDGPAVFAPQD